MKGAALSTTLLDPLQRPGACNWTALAMRTRETRYDVQTTLDAQETTCFKQDKMEIQFGGGDTEPHGRWFCTRSFKTAVGSRLKDAEASEGLA